jgi:hypothetical protein
VRVVGVAGDLTLDTAAELTLTDRFVRLSLDRGDVALAYEGLDGAQSDGLLLVLAGRDGAALRVEGLPRAPLVADEICERGATVPEFTRGLRAFASVRGDVGSDHDVFFGPLLTARRAVHEAPSAAARIRAVSPAALREALAAARLELARRRWPDERDAGDRRALLVELEELQAPVLAAVTAVGHAAEAWASSPGAARLREWRRWCAAFTAVWEAADAAWLAALPALADSRGADGALWRRVLKRSKA